MRKWLIGLGILLLVVLVLVIIAPDWDDVPPTNEEEQEALNPVVEQELEVVEIVPEDIEEPTQTDTGNRYDSSTDDNIIFYYSTSGFSGKDRLYHVKGDMAKVELAYFENIGYEKIDTIYLNKKMRTAVAYCEEKGVCKDRNREFQVDFEVYDVLTPVEWDAKFTRIGYFGDDTVNSKQTKIYVEKGVKYWLDLYYNLPIKVEDVDTTHYYSIQSFNQVTDEDIAHQDLFNY